MIRKLIYQHLKLMFRSSHPEVFLEKGVLKICNKFTVEYPCRSVILIKLRSNFIEIAFRHGCSPVNLLHIFRTLFSKTTSGWLLLYFEKRSPLYNFVWKDIYTLPQKVTINTYLTSFQHKILNNIYFSQRQKLYAFIFLWFI